MEYTSEPCADQAGAVGIEFRVQVEPTRCSLFRYGERAIAHDSGRSDLAIEECGLAERRAGPALQGYRYPFVLRRWFAILLSLIFLALDPSHVPVWGQAAKEGKRPYI